GRALDDRRRALGVIEPRDDLGARPGLEDEAPREADGREEVLRVAEEAEGGVVERGREPEGLLLRAQLADPRGQEPRRWAGGRLTDRPRARGSGPPHRSVPGGRRGACRRLARTGRGAAGSPPARRG